MKAPREILAALFTAAVKAADPARGIAAHLPEKPRGRVVVVGAGKASARMAQVLEELWDGPLGGLVVTRYGYDAPTRHIEIAQAAHPVPDAAGEAAARRMLGLVGGLSGDDLVIALISGGGSALLPVPPPGLSLADEQALNAALLASGMPIHEMNCVRKHASLIKGGRLAAAAFPARVVSFVISDIPGDDPALVASGPTIPDGRTRAQALQSVADFGLTLPPVLQQWLESDAARAPSPDDPRFARNQVHLIASAGISLAAATAAAEGMGLEARIISDAIEGEAREAGREHARILRAALQKTPRGKPLVLLSGGETTVTMAGKAGRGGRNSEFLLALACEITGFAGVHALAADTDGIDGSENNAGAFADGDSTARMMKAGILPERALAEHAAWDAFNAAGDLFVTGPTRTNVNDFRALLILPSS